MNRKCRDCATELPATTEYFYVYRQSPCGLDGYCKPCRRGRNAATYLKHKQKRNADSLRVYYANRDACLARFKKYREREAERLSAQGRTYYLENRDALLKKNSAYRVTIPEKMAEYKAVYLQRHPERRKETALRDRIRRRGKMPPNKEIRDYLKIIKNDPCSYCGEHKARMTIDHVVPVVAGGGHEVGNFTRACQSCNSRKHAKPLFVFLAEQWSR